MILKKLIQLFLKANFCLVALLAISTPLTAAELATPSMDDIEYPDDEPNTPAEIELGKILFFDPRLSINQNQSCASCHNPDLGFSDGLALGIGTMGEPLERHTQHLYNLAWSATMFWDGRMTTLEQQALGPIEAAGEMNMPLNKLLSRLNAVPYYVKTFANVYADGLTKENLGHAIAAFERTIISNNAPFDRYLAGDKAAMSPAQIRGLALFKGKARCTSCHDGANFTDDSFHNIGLASKDPGRAAINGEKTMKGAMKTPGLRNIVFSAPYMHDGSLASLQAVVEHYNTGGIKSAHLDSLMKPLNLSQQEVFDLVAFMGALSDPVIIERPQIP